MAEREARSVDVVGSATGPAGLDRAVAAFVREVRGPAWMAMVRRRAWQRFEATGWPSPQEEAWRRTDLSGVDFDRYRPVSRPDPGERRGDPAVDAAPLEEPVAGWAGHAVFRRGDCVGLGLRREWTREGVSLISLDPVSAHPFQADGPARGEVLEVPVRLMQEGIARAENRLQFLHYSLLSHGAYLYVPPYVEIPEPILVDFEETPEGGGAGTLTSPHLFVVLGRGARAVVIHRLSSGDGPELLCNAGLDIRVGEGAGLVYHAVQDLAAGSLHFSHGEAHVARDGSLRSFDAPLGGRLAKTRLGCRLVGEGASALLHGTYAADAERHLDIGLVQQHAEPRSTSRALYKGVVTGGARTVFQGLIEVAPAAAGTDAYLSNRNLILEEGARADSIPSLEIGTNDVKCSHGSTTGRIRDEEVFYLMSRGLTRAEAKEILVLGFFEEVLQRADHRFADDVRRRIAARVGAG